MAATCFCWPELKSMAAVQLNQAADLLEELVPGL